MQEEKLVELINKIQRYQCEFQHIEIKTAEKGCPKLFDSLSSFSNQDTGGIIICGLKEKERFTAVGVYDVQDLQQKIASQCKQMEPELRPLFTTTMVDDKAVVAIEVPGLDVVERPVFYKGAGRLRGSYVRVGDADEPMNEYEIYTYDAFRRRIRDDLRVVSEAKASLLQQDLLNKYLAAIKEEHANLARNTTDEEILELMGVLDGGVPTLAGVMAFGKYPQGYFPQLGITAVVVPGTQMGQLGEDGERFIANKRINGTIPEMLEEAVEFVKRNMRVKTIINAEGRRDDKPEFPLTAIREIILNALVHRDYSIHTEGTPVTICMFADRLEVTNKGGLYGRISVDALGKVHPDTRNPALANMLEVLHIAENRYSGIPTIRREMERAGLPAPEFSSVSGEFKVTLRNNIRRSVEPAQYTPYKANPVQYMVHEDEVTEQYGKVTQADVKYLTENERRLLDFCCVERDRKEIEAFMGFSRFYTMSKLVKPLVERGLLTMTIPEKPKSREQRWLTAKQ